VHALKADSVTADSSTDAKKASPIAIALRVGNLPHTESTSGHMHLRDLRSPGATKSLKDWRFFDR